MRALAAVVLAMLALPGIASGAQATLIDLEDEVMCPICGTLLELAEAPQAQRQRAYIAGLIAEGKSKAEIKDALVAEYGHEVLALPEGSGFNLSAYLAPAIGFVVALVALGFGVARWRRAGNDSPPPDGESGPQDKDAKRLEDDLARYDL